MKENNPDPGSSQEPFPGFNSEAGPGGPQENVCQALIDSTPDCIILHQDFKVVFCNQQTLDFFHIHDPQDILGRTIFDFIDLEGHEKARTRSARVQSGEAVPLMEFKIEGGDGLVHDVTVTSAPIQHESKPAVLTFFRDITTESQTRRDLEASQERLDLALQATRDGVWDWDISADKMVYSDSWATMLGYRLGEISPDTMNWKQLIHPEDLFRSKSLLDNHLAGFIPSYEIEVRLRHKRGHYIWVQDRGRVVQRDAQGTPLRMAGTQRDITPRKEAEVALELRNQVAEAFLTQDSDNPYQESLAIMGRAISAGLGIFLSVDGQEKFRVLAVNPAHIGPGLSLDDFQVFDPKSPPPLIEYLLTDLKPLLKNSPPDVPGHPLQIKNFLRVPITNRDKILGCFILANKEKGFTKADQAMLESLAGYIAPILDSHIEAENKETQLRQAQKMEALGALAGGIAHDFNNILQAILGFSTLALEDVHNPAIVESDLARVVKATKRGQELVKRILLFSRREEQSHGPVDITAIVDEAVNLLIPSIPSTIEIRAGLNAPNVMVMGDSGQINQVILNLATNAYHAMEKHGGRLDINLSRTHSEKLDWDLPLSLQDVDLVALTMSDTGVGMNQRVKDRVFDPFFTTKEVGQGTGLGLSVVHGIVRAHRGDILVDSQPEIGTTITVVFPSLYQESEQSPAKTAQVEPLSLVGNKLITILDDEQDITDLGEAMLIKLGYLVNCENNGRTLLAKMEVNPQFCDLVITDLTMPQITGLQLAERLFQINPELPIVLITGMDVDDDAMLKDFPNVKGILRKPFSRDSLRDTVEKVFRTTTLKEEP